jgi:hypothetical protein
MPLQRPLSVTVLGVLHLVFGVLGLICGAAGLGFQSTGGQKQMTELLKQQLPDQKEDWEFAERFNEGVEGLLPWYRTYEAVTSVVDLGISLVLVVAGLGLLRMAPWGRTASFLYVALSLATQTAAIVVDAAVLTPAQNRWLDAEEQRDPAQKTRVDANRSNLAETIGPSLIGFAYPVIVLIILTRPSVAAAFRGEPTGPEDIGDRFDRTGGEAPGSYPPGYCGEPDDRIGPARF